MQENNYDAGASQRLEFIVTSGASRYDTAHLYGPLTDERYLQFLHSINRQLEGEEQTQDVRLKISTLWDDLVTDVENVEKEGLENWKSLIEQSEKNESMAKFLAVLVIEPEKIADGKRPLTSADNQVITTEAYFNFPETVQQTHILKNTADEMRRKYDRIQRSKWRESLTKGLRKKSDLEYIPQDERLGKLYDEMLIKATGFANNEIPLRFKTTVLESVFASGLDEKK